MPDNEWKTTDVTVDGVIGKFHFEDSEEPDKDPARSITLDIGQRPDILGIEAWMTIEGDEGMPIANWNLFQISISIRQTEETQHLIDLDNIDADLDNYPSLVALVQRMCDACPELHL